MTIRLKVVDYHKYTEDDGTKIAGIIEPLPEMWISAKGGIVKDRNVPCAMLTNLFTKLVDSFRRHYGGLEWAGEEKDVDYESAENVEGMLVSGEMLGELGGREDTRGSGRDDFQEERGSRKGSGREKDTRDRKTGDRNTTSTSSNNNVR